MPPLLLGFCPLTDTCPPLGSCRSDAVVLQKWRSATSQLTLFEIPCWLRGFWGYAAAAQGGLERHGGSRKRMVPAVLLVVRMRTLEFGR